LIRGLQKHGNHLGSIRRGMPAAGCAYHNGVVAFGIGKFSSRRCSPDADIFFPHVFPVLLAVVCNTGAMPLTVMILGGSDTRNGAINHLSWSAGESLAADCESDG